MHHVFSTRIPVESMDDVQVAIDFHEKMSEEDPEFLAKANFLVTFSEDQQGLVLGCLSKEVNWKMFSSFLLQVAKQLQWKGSHRLSYAVVADEIDTNYDQCGGGFILFNWDQGTFVGSDTFQVEVMTPDQVAERFGS